MTNFDSAPFPVVTAASSAAAVAWNTFVGTYVNVVPLSITVPYPTDRSPELATV